MNYEEETPVPSEPVDAAPDTEQAAEPVDAAPEEAPTEDTPAEEEHPLVEGLKDVAALMDAVEEVQEPTGAVTEEDDLPGDEDDEPTYTPEEDLPSEPVEDGDETENPSGNGGMK